VTQNALFESGCMYCTIHTPYTLGLPVYIDSFAHGKQPYKNTRETIRRSHSHGSTLTPGYFLLVSRLDSDTYPSEISLWTQNCRYIAVGVRSCDSYHYWHV